MMNFITTYFDEDDESSDNTSDNHSCEHVSDDSEHSNSDELDYDYDCPLLFIEEKEHDSTTDTRAYIYYNIDCKMYHIIGKRRNSRHSKSIPYSFMCKQSKDIISFLMSIIGRNNLNIELHNSHMISDVTFDYLSRNIHGSTEIVAYDCISFDKYKYRYVVEQLLSICRHFRDPAEVDI